MSDAEGKWIGRLNQFIDHGDGTLTDTRTGLMWMREREVSKVGVVEAMAIRKEFAGYRDWRLPTLTELKSIAPSDYIRCFAKPVAGYYWSSTKQKTADSYDSWYAIINSTGSVGAGNPSTGVEYVRLVRFAPRFAVTTATTGSGSGFINISVSSDGNRQNFEGENYAVNSIVTLTAHPVVGSKFIRWGGSVGGSDAVCTLTVDGEKIISAEFERLGYSLDLKVLGSGCITRSVEANEYLHDTVISLTAIPDKGFQFKRWSGHASGTNPVFTVKFDTEKTIIAEFGRLFPLTVNTSGTGAGTITQNPMAAKYMEGNQVTLTAESAVGSRFLGWQGAMGGQAASCTVTMDSAKTAIAEFEKLAICKLNITKVGAGQGIVNSSSNAEKNFAGSKLTLTAKPLADSYFSGWGGDIGILDEAIELAIHSDTSVTAQFELKMLQDTDIALAFESAQKITLKTGESVFVFTLRLTNQADKQLRLNLPKSVYINVRGEEIDQSDWVVGMLNGEAGGTLRAGNSRQVGLVFTLSRLGKCATGDQLCVTVMQAKPAVQLDFVLRCKSGASQEFELISATAEQDQPKAAPAETTALTAMQAQIEALQAQLLGMTQAITQLPAAVTRVTPPVPTQTLPEVLAWLCTQASVPMAVLRLKLLPLDLMSSAVIDDINERAYDLAGEAALDDSGDAVTVQRGVLLQVLAAWEV